MSDILGKMAVIFLLTPVALVIYGQMGWSGLVLAALLLWGAVRIYRLARRKWKERI